MFNNDKKLLALLGLIITTAWISQSLMDFCILALLGFLISNWKQFLSLKLFATLQNKVIFTAFAGYFAVAVIAAIFNAHPDYDTFGNLSKFVWILQFLLFYWAAIQIDWSKLLADRLQNIFHFFAWATLIPIVYGFNIYLFEGVDIITLQQTSYRIVGLLNSATYHGLVGGLLFCFLLPLCLFNLRRLNWNTRLLNLIYFTLILISTTLTMTRGVWVSLFISGIVLVYFLNFKKLLLSTIVVALIAVAIFQDPIKTMINNRANSDSCRVKILQTHWTIFKTYPLLGLGYRDNLRSIKEFWPESEAAHCQHLRDNGNHAHNQYLNVLATTGVLGFLFFISFYFYFIVLNLKLLSTYRSHHYYHNSGLYYPLCVSLLMMQVFFMVSNMTETSFEYGKVRTVLLIVWAVVLALSKKLRTPRAQQPDQK